MNIDSLIKNIIDQVKEAQLKLGYEKELIRLYFPVSSMNALLNTEFMDITSMINELRAQESFRDTELGWIKFFARDGRIEVRVPPQGSEYVHTKVEDPVFLKSIIELFGSQHHLSIEDICGCFEESRRAYICEKMTADTDFDYVLYFEDESFDPYYYCIKMEMGHTIYHRFMRSDYLDLLV